MAAKKKPEGESYGPYEKYAEVETSRGVYGIQAGEVLAITADGVERSGEASFEKEPDGYVPTADASPTAEPDVVLS
jgi:hypothetical protein